MRGEVLERDGEKTLFELVGDDNSPRSRLSKNWRRLGPAPMSSLYHPSAPRKKAAIRNNCFYFAGTGIAEPLPSGAPAGSSSEGRIGKPAPEPQIY
jgi:hypothetical protein